MKVVLLAKRGKSLVAEDRHALDVLDAIKDGQNVKVSITVPRNLRHHRLFFALLRTVLDAQTEPRLFNSEKELLETLKVACGHVEPYYKSVAARNQDTGKMEWTLVKEWRGASIDFSAMDQQAFRVFFDRAVSVVLERILPNCPREGLEDQIYHCLGERGPGDYVH